MTAAYNSLEYFSHCFSQIIRFDISCESSARQRIHTKHQALFSLKIKRETIIRDVCCNFAWLFKGYYCTCLLVAIKIFPSRMVVHHIMWHLIRAYTANRIFNQK